MTEEIHVRIGTPDDVDPMMRLALAAVDDNGFLNPNPLKILDHIWAALNREAGIVGIIGEIGSEPEAAILLRIGEIWYSDDKVIEEKSIFVRPEFREAKGGRASKLVDFAKSVQASLNIPLSIGVLSNERTEAKVRLYERKLGKASGAYFLYGARTGEIKEAAE